MTTDRSVRRIGRGVALVAMLGLVAACGGSDDVASGGTSATGSASSDSTAVSVVDDNTQVSDTEAEAEAEAETETETDEAATLTGDGSASLSLENGESFQFSILCNLEPQTVAGSEILYTATSYDDPGVDVTQFGDSGPAAGVATISVFDGNFDSLWEAGSRFESLGGSLDISLDGSTITGSGKFFQAGDMSGDPVNGTLTANC